MSPILSPRSELWHGPIDCDAVKPVTHHRLSVISMYVVFKSEMNMLSTLRDWILSVLSHMRLRGSPSNC